MGIFGNLFGNKEKENETVSNTTQGTVTTASPVPQLLNLNKGDILDLTKYSASLSNVRAAAGWDVNHSGGSDYDLDLCAFLCSHGRCKHTVYYGDKKSKGIYLDGDNLTGAGDGDDENIHVNLNGIDASIDKIIFAVVIYQARSRGQNFNHVKNAYMRIVDESNGNEICRYSLSSDGKNNTAATLASLNKNSDGNWSFEAIGEYSKNSIESLKNTLV